MKSNSTGRAMWRERSLMNMNAPFSTPTSSGGRPCVVGGDLLAELGDPGRQLVGRHQRPGPGAGPRPAPRMPSSTTAGRSRRESTARSRCKRPSERTTRQPRLHLGGPGVVAGDLQDPVDRGGVDGVVAAHPPPQPGPQRPAGRGRARRPGGRAASVGSSTGGEAVEQVRLLAHQLGLPGEDRHHVPSGDVVEQRAAPRGGPGCGGAWGRRWWGRRTAPGPRPRRARPSRRGAGRAAGGAGSRRMPARPGRPRAPQQVEEHGLGLVVAGVAGEHVGGQHAVAGGPGPGLRFGPGHHRHLLGSEARRRSARRPPATTSASSAEPGPEAVVDVDGGDLAARRRWPGPAGPASRRRPDTAQVTAVPAAGNGQRASRSSVRPSGRSGRRRGRSEPASVSGSRISASVGSRAGSSQHGVEGRRAARPPRWPR